MLTGASVPAAPAEDAELARAVAAGSSDPVLSAATNAVIRGDDARVLTLTDSDALSGAAPDQRSPWLDYDRAIALGRLGRTDDAVAAYESAAKRFESRGQSGERAKAIYGEAQALSAAHRCKDAWRKYQQYAAIVRPTNERDAKLAVTYANDCHGAPDDVASKEQAPH
jgi:tetratricopeptide (TPR) repeat protein